ncbi:MAG TPA: Tim44 domain-containing protein [Thermopetrobacter sp.]|nr:Tim44 domain-containing protein [Thermopetrobacter sp.]
MSQVFDPLNLLLLAVAVVILLKLRSVLGTRTGHEKTIEFPPLDATKAPPVGARTTTPAGAADGEMPARGLPEERQPVWAGVAEEGSELAKVLQRIAQKDPSFDARHFLQGAGTAYEMIVTAFAEGDKKTLRPLLTRDVYKGFAGAIDERRKKGEELSLRFVSLDEAKLARGNLRGNRANLTVKFVSQVITALKDKEGRIIEGAPDEITVVKDVWTFTRDVTSRDPNWKLAATEAQE